VGQRGPAISLSPDDDDIMIFLLEARVVIGSLSGHLTDGTRG
jgi:hypothetical protein